MLTEDEMTRHQISEDEVFQAMARGLTADIAWPLALESVLSRHGVRFRATGAILRKIELEPPYTLWRNDANRCWIVEQAA